VSPIALDESKIGRAKKLTSCPQKANREREREREGRRESERWTSWREREDEGMQGWGGGLKKPEAACFRLRRSVSAQQRGTESSVIVRRIRRPEVTEIHIGKTEKVSNRAANEGTIPPLVNQVMLRLLVRYWLATHDEPRGFS